MSDYGLQQKLLEYVNAATDLAESVKRNIVKSKKGIAVIDDETVIKLNKFMIAANHMKDFEKTLILNTININ
jgi:hypothetical protein